MQKLFFLFAASLFLFSCGDDGDDTPVGNYRQEMRNFVQGISSYAKEIHKGFAIVPQNGIELVSANGEGDGTPVSEYLDAIDANGQEDLLYGYNNDDEPTPVEDANYIKSFLNISKNAGNVIFVSDYCYTHTKMDDSYSQNAINGYISFAASSRELDVIPDYPATIHNENADTITSIKDVKNFLYLINPSRFSTKEQFINAVTATNYDLLIMDLFFNDGSEFYTEEIAQLKKKANGGSRLIICYMSIGEAEDYRYYWQPEWSTNKPSWLDEENPEWEGNYKVKYWDKEWQSIIYGNDNSYLQKILNAGFDGVYLDIIEAFEYYE